MERGGEAIEENAESVADEIVQKKEMSEKERDGGKKSVKERVRNRN